MAQTPKEAAKQAVARAESALDELEDDDTPLPPPKPLKFVTATVARGRTVVTGSFKKKNVVYNGPGSVVRIPEDDAERLTRLGYLVSANGNVFPGTTDGPPVGSEQATVIG